MDAMITDIDLSQGQSRAVGDPVVATDRIAMAIRAWLDDVQAHGSPRTLTAYADILGSFRAFIQAQGYDLANPHTPQLAQVAKTWAELRAGEEHIPQEERRGVAPATYNLRLATISSFYTYANRFGWLNVANPIDRVRRARNDTYERAEALSVAAVTQALREIDRSTERGLRDYALLTIALVTGRRLSEMAGMRWGHVHPQYDRVLLHFPRTKGDKVMRDLLPPNVSRALLVWVETFYGQQLGELGRDTPVWVVLKTSAKARRGAPATIQTLADICKKHLGTSKFHALRHTFAKTMEDKGAKVTEIQARLGHRSLATTSTYLAALDRERNPYAEALESTLGI